MDVIGARECGRPAEGGANRQAFDHDHRHNEPDEREPSDRGQDEDDSKEGEGRERETPSAPRRREYAGRRPFVFFGDEHRRRDERDGEQRPRDNRLEQHGRRPIEADRHRVDDADGDPKGKRAPEPAGVEADRLGDQLPDGACLGW